MANLALVRVDNRLIHGQVATGFIGKLGVGKIVVIDDKTATNEFARDVLALAVPPGVTLEVYTAAQAAEVWKKDQFGTGTVMVIAKSIPTVFQAFEGGFAFSSLMIGGTAIAPDRKKIEGAISLNAEEAGMLDQMAEKDIKITFQQTAQTRITSWHEIRKRLPF